MAAYQPVVQACGSHRKPAQQADVNIDCVYTDKHRKKHTL
jgi:hypothetical protein